MDGDSAVIVATFVALGPFVSHMIARKTNHSTGSLYRLVVKSPSFHSSKRRRVHPYGVGPPPAFCILQSMSEFLSLVQICGLQ